MALWQCYIQRQKKCVKYTIKTHRVKIILRMLNHY